MNERIQATPEYLTLDPLNPRLHGMEGERTQRAVMLRHLGEYQTVRLACDMIDGRYLAAAPLLAVMEEGRAVVIDGNRRLSAIMALRDPSLAEEAGVHEITLDRAQKPRNAPDTMEVILMESRREAMAARIAHEKAAKSIWGHLAHARHYLELRREGWSSREIHEMYSYNDWLHGPMSVPRKVEALLAMDQINEGREHPWDGAGNYQRLERALGVPAVRGMLNMEISPRVDIDPEARPIPEESMERAVRLMEWIQGSARGSGEFRQPRVDLPEEADILGRVCADDRAIALMDRAVHLGARSVIDQLESRRNVEAENRLKGLENLARSEMDRMRSDPESELKVPGDIHLSDVTHELHLDGAVQYRVLLVSRDPGRDEMVRAELQRTLREQEGQKCRVELIADRPAG